MRRILLLLGAALYSG